MSIVPRKLQRILAHRLRRQRLHQWLEHRQSSWRQLLRLARLASRFRSLILAKRARASIPQERKRIDGPVPILPLNLHPRPRRQTNHHRLGIVPHPRSKIRQHHKLKYRTCRCGAGAPARVPTANPASRDRVGTAAPGCPSRAQLGRRTKSGFATKGPR